MERLFLDTNIVVDLLGEREPYYQSAAKIATLADKGEIKIFVSTLTYSTVFYLLSRYESNDAVKEKIRKFKVIAKSSDLTDKIVDKGLSSRFNDFEDSLQYFCAVNSECDAIITRNGKDFKVSDLPVLTSEEYIIGRKSR